MKFTAASVAVAAFASQATAHYIFEVFDGNPVYEYIRPNTNYNSPVTDLTSNDLRCNVGGESGANTKTMTVAAGSTHTFTTDTAVYHDGPISFYMSKAPSTAASYDGSGGWFKIKDIGPTFSGTAPNCQSTWDLVQEYSIQIPSCIPSGDYLLKVQSLAIHNPWPAGIPQWYTECAQITVTGGGSKAPTSSQMISIPGGFKQTDPGYTVNIYNQFCNYTVPGPSVFTC